MNLIYSKGIFMRTDIFDFIRTIIINGIKPNYSKIARHFNVIQELLSIIFKQEFKL